MSIPSFLRLKGDLIVWVIFFALCLISLVEVFSATSMLAYGSGSYMQPFMRQAAFLGVGVLICVMVHNIPYGAFRFLTLMWPVILLLLILAIALGSKTNDASRWVGIGSFSFQPSEMAKGILVATIALVLSRCRDENGIRKDAMRNVAIFTLPIALLIFKENISTAVFLCGVIYVMMFVAGVPAKQMTVLTLGGLIFVGVAVASLKVFPDKADAPFYQTTVGSYFRNRIPTAKERIFGKSLIITENPDSLVVNDKNMQVVHARIAVANNNHGIGRMPGNSVERDYLPQAYSDFIFAIIVEETGIWGGGIVVFLYLLLLARIGTIALKCRDRFAINLALGLGVLLVGQALLNMFVAVGIGPVTGQTLPLISRGGTSTLITCAYFGIILSISWSAVKTNKPAVAATDDAIQDAAETTSEQPVTEVKDLDEQEEDETEPVQPAYETSGPVVIDLTDDESLDDESSNSTENR